MRKRAALILAVITGFSLAAPAQSPDLEAKGNQENPLVPTITFTLDWPEADPDHYALVVESTGRAAYESAARRSLQLADAYSFKFTISEATRSHIFDIARSLDYFNHNFEYKKGKVAFTGRKTVAYADSSRHAQTTYNWSDNPSLRQLTDLLQAIAATLEFGRTLEYLHRHDRLGLNAELKRMDEMAANKQLAELQAITPQLEQIAADSSVMEIARQKARRLLQRANAGLQAANATPVAQQ